MTFYWSNKEKNQIYSLPMNLFIVYVFTICPSVCISHEHFFCDPALLLGDVWCCIVGTDCIICCRDNIPHIYDFCNQSWNELLLLLFSLEAVVLKEKRVEPVSPKKGVSEFFLILLFHSS